MTGLWVTGGILLLLLLLLQIRLRVIFRCREEGPEVSAGIGVFRIPLYPPTEKKRKEKVQKKPRKSRQKKSVEEEPSKEKKRGVPLELFRDLLPIVLELAGRLKRKIRIDLLELDLTWGAEDPADAAMEYGYAHAAMGAVLPLLEANFMIKNKKIQISLDYGTDKPRMYARASGSMTLGQILSLGLYTGLKGLKLYRKYHHRKTGKATKKAVQS